MIVINDMFLETLLLVTSIPYDYFFTTVVMPIITPRTIYDGSPLNHGNVEYMIMYAVMSYPFICFYIYIVFYPLLFFLHRLMMYASVVHAFIFNLVHCIVFYSSGTET